MDGQFIFEKIFDGGFSAETRRELELMDSVRDFVYKDKTDGLFKARKGTEKQENYDEIILVIKPTINFLGLFSENNNYSPSLEKAIQKPAIMLKFFGGEGNFRSALGSHSLGESFNVMVDGYGKNNQVEGFRVKLPSEVEDLINSKNKTIGYFATATSKNGKSGDVRGLEFTGVRPTMAKMRLGVSTSFGVVYDEDELSKLEKRVVLDKARLV